MGLRGCVVTVSIPLPLCTKRSSDVTWAARKMPPFENSRYRGASRARSVDANVRMDRGSATRQVGALGKEQGHAERDSARIAFRGPRSLPYLVSTEEKAPRRWTDRETLDCARKSSGYMTDHHGRGETNLSGIRVPTARGRETMDRTTSPFYQWLDHERIRTVLSEVRGLRAGERLVLLKGIVPSLVEALGADDARSFPLRDGDEGAAVRGGAHSSRRRAPPARVSR